MALASLRLRRAVSLSSSLLRDCRLFSSAASSPPLTLSASVAAGGSSLPSRSPGLRRPHLLIHYLSFRSSVPMSSSRTGGGSDEKFGPDDILFEGCDYNHWLITMDFPKDPAPTREEMIETYIQTLAKVVGSVEEAKKRMYALSTTTYHGFQAVMTEEMSEKFRGLPGVVFILPDSYIDPVNKEYGGDKYDNGVITPRPPPIQYGRQGRVRNQNRSDRPNYNSRPPPQGNLPNDQQGARQGDGWRYPPQQNYNQPGQYPPQQSYNQPGQYPPQQNYNQPGQYSPQQNYNQPGQYGRGYDAPGGKDFVPSGERRDFRQGEERNYAQSSARDGFQGEHGEPMPSYQRNFSQGDHGNFAPPEHNNFTRGPGGGNMYGNPSSYGDNRQGSGPSYKQDYRQETVSEHRQDMNSGYGGESTRVGGSGYGGEYSQEPSSAYGQRNGPAEGQQGSGQNILPDLMNS
ncbi:hypothetical protein Cni_G12646 [Canna indica]|uniref:MORF/ORRM1/DAG-like MORF domain-containing protein n=1 Tax=Canna indica TaxID=4628 RepID=A0AAQ3KDW3_9LILI|nr:hypothetical protein Cni_G12646 [Canna indica]